MYRNLESADLGNPLGHEFFLQRRLATQRRAIDDHDAERQRVQVFLQSYRNQYPNRIYQMIMQAQWSNLEAEKQLIEFELIRLQIVRLMFNIALIRRHNVFVRYDFYIAMYSFFWAKIVLVIFLQFIIC